MGKKKKSTVSAFQLVTSQFGELCPHILLFLGLIDPSAQFREMS